MSQLHLKKCRSHKRKTLSSYPLLWILTSTLLQKTKPIVLREIQEARPSLVVSSFSRPSFALYTAFADRKTNLKLKYKPPAPAGFENVPPENIAYQSALFPITRQIIRFGDLAIYLATRALRASATRPTLRLGGRAEGR